MVSKRIWVVNYPLTNFVSGTETIVNLHLYDENLVQHDIKAENAVLDLKDTPPVSSVSDDLEIKMESSSIDFVTDHVEEVIAEETPISTCQSEHDYCSQGDQPSDDNSYQQFLTEHSYFSNGTFTKSEENHSYSDASSSTSNLTFGIIETPEENNANNAVVEEAVLFDSHIMPVQSKTSKVFYTLQKIETDSGPKIVAIKRRKPHESFLKTVMQKKGTVGAKNGMLEHKADIDYEKYKIYLPINRIKNANEAMFFLLKRLPLVTTLAADVNYKCTYPYAASTIEEFCSWNSAKRSSAEVTILNFIIFFKCFHIITDWF